MITNEVPEGIIRMVGMNDLVREVVAGDWGGPNPVTGTEPCRVVRGTDFRKVASGLVDGVPLRYLRHASIRSHRLAAEDLVVEMSGGSATQSTGRILRIPQRAVEASDHPLLFSNFTKLMRLRDDVDPQYFEYAWLDLYERGATRRHENRTTGIRNFQLQEFLGAEVIPLPPLPEQRAIANVLSAIQRRTQTADQMRSALDRMRRALIAREFAPVRALLSDSPQETDRAGEHWAVVILGDVVECQLGKMLSPKARTTGVRRPYLRNKNVQWGRFDLTDVAHMGFNESEAAKFDLRPGDLLVCEGGEVGRAAVWDGVIANCGFQKALHRLRPRSNRVAVRFLAYELEYLFSVAAIYGDLGTKTTIAHLPSVKLKSLRVAVPRPEAQESIAQRIEAVDCAIEATNAEAHALRQLFRSALSELLTGRRRIAA